MKKVFMKVGNRTLSKRFFSIMLIIGILFSMMPDATYADNSGRPPDAIEQEDTEDTESEMSDNKAAEPEQNTASDETAQDESSYQDTQTQDVQTESDINYDNEIATQVSSEQKVYAILYKSGELHFQYGNAANSSKGGVKAIYQVANSYTSSASVPWYSNRTLITKVTSDKITCPARTSYWFCGCSNLTSLDVSNFNTANVTSMSSMFYNCSNLTSLDVSNFNTVNVTSMYAMFYNCSSLTSLDLSNFDTAKVTNMYAMFNNCSNLTSLDVSNFDTAKVPNMRAMFYNCNKLQKVTLSKDFKFVGADGYLPAPSTTYIPNATGKWKNTAGKTFAPSEIPNNVADTYVADTAINYKIAYNLNGGTKGTNAPTSATYDSVVTISNPTKSGYTFAGWTFNGSTSTAKTGTSSTTVTTSWSNASTKVKNQYFKNLTSTADATVTLTANWSANGYTVSFNYNKPSTATGTMSGNGTTSKGVTYAAAYGTLPQPSMPGWTFDGWYTVASGGSRISATTTYTAAGNQTLYAHWTLNTYSISYNANGGSLSGQKTSYNVNTDSFTLPTPTKNGYTFTGWTGTGLSSATKSVTVNKGSTGNRSYTANWTPVNYTISYNANGGSLSGQKTSYNIETATFTLPTPTRTGYTFTGWTGSNGTTAQKSVTITKGSTGNKSYTANWSINTYSIGYTLNGGSISGQPTSYNVETATFTLPQPTRTGYTFTGWTGSNGTTAQKTVTIAKGSTGNKSYTANWTPTTWTVKYDANGGTGTMSTDTATYNENYVAKANQFTRIGYEFAGWTENADGSGSNWTSWIGKPWKWTYTKNITLYAQWKANTYTNSILHWAEGFKYSEGNNSNKNALRLKDTCFSASYKSDIVMDSAKAVKIPNGYYLRGLGTSEADGTFKGYSMGLKLTQKPASMWFEYYYDPVSYSITYSLNGGTNNNSNPSTYDVLYGVSLKAPTRTGYTFTGWYDENGNKITGINEGCNATFRSADDLYAKLATRTTGNRILTAHWSYNPVSVKVPQVLTGDHTGRSQFRVKCDDFKAGNIKVTVPNSFSYKQTGKADVTAVITAKSGNNVITPSNKVCVYNITTKSGLSAGCWQGSFNIELTLTKE